MNFKAILDKIKPTNNKGSSQVVLCEPHGAIGWDLLNKERGKDEVGIFLCTAHPAKFKENVDEILGQDIPLPGPLAKHVAMESLSGVIPADFAALKAKMMK